MEHDPKNQTQELTAKPVSDSFKDVHHYIAAQIPAEEGCEFFVNGDRHSVRGIGIRIDIRSQEPFLTAELLYELPTNARNLTIRLQRTGNQILRVKLRPIAVALPEPLHLEMGLIDRKDIRILREYLQLLATHPDNKPPEK